VEFTSFLWVTVFAIGAFAGGAGYSVLGVTSSRFRHAKILFWLSGASVGAIAMLFGLTVPASAVTRIIGTGIIGALSAIIFVETTLWVNRIERGQVVPGIEGSALGGLTSAQLRQRALTLARDLRDLESSYQQKQSQIMDEFQRKSVLPITDPKKAAELFTDRTSAITRLANEKRAEYHNRFHVEANSVYEELCRRLNIPVAEPGGKPPDGQINMIEYTSIITMRTGMLAGAQPLNYVANVIQRMAERL
jgi:hypothetical protein